MAQRPVPVTARAHPACIPLPRIIAVFFGIALLARIGLLLQPLPALDALFIPDDAYYTLSIARSIFAGLGPSADGVIPTTGFQPLLVLFQLPLFLFAGDPDFAVKGTLAIGAIFGAGNVAILGSLLARIADRRAAIFAMLIAALHPIVVKNDLNGLETSLAGLFALLMLLGYARAWAEPRAGTWIGLGLVCGLAVLARIDNCFLATMIGLFGWRRWGFRPALVVAMTAGFVVLPYWLYCMQLSGSPIPESGAAVQQIVDFHRSEHLGPLTALAAGLTTMGYWLAPGAVPGPLLTMLGVAVLSILLLVPRRLRRLRDSGRDVIAVAGISAAILLAFYILYLPAVWFFERYFYVVLLVFILLVSVGLADMTDGAARAFARPYLRTAIAACAVGLFLAGCVGTWSVFFSRPEASVDTGVRGAKGYREVARHILRHLPDGAVVGAMQSGALGFYARHVRVINLDGVVNSRASQALRQQALGRYAAEERIGYFADWRLNVDMLARFYGDGWRPDLLTPEFSAAPQGGDRTTLYALGTRP